MAHQTHRPFKELQEFPGDEYGLTSVRHQHPNAVWCDICPSNFANYQARYQLRDHRSLSAFRDVCKQCALGDPRITLFMVANGVTE